MSSVVVCWNLNTGEGVFGSTKRKLTPPPPYPPFPHSLICNVFSSCVFVFFCPSVVCLPLSFLSSPGCMSFFFYLCFFVSFFLSVFVFLFLSSLGLLLFLCPPPPLLFVSVFFCLLFCQRPGSMEDHAEEHGERGCGAHRRRHHYQG